MLEFSSLTHEINKWWKIFIAAVINCGNMNVQKKHKLYKASYSYRIHSKRWFVLAFKHTTNSFNRILRYYTFLSYQDKVITEVLHVVCAVILQNGGIKAPAIPEHIFPANYCFSCNMMRPDRRLPSSI